jgi:hypothetical protein
MKEATCLCGWQTRGTLDEIIAAVQEHGDREHGYRPTREEILAITVDLDEASDGQPV